MNVALPLARRTLQPQPKSSLDRRRHKRFALTLLGRFMRENKQEYPCRLNDISVGGAAMSSPVAVAVGEKIIAYFDHVGGLEGQVVRVFDGGFAFRIAATQHKREKLAAQITWLINKTEIAGIEERRHERWRTNPPTATILTLAEGISIDCHILDFSLSGASVATEARPPIGNDVMLGRLRCRVIRYHERGIGVQFLDIQEPEALRKYFG